MISPPDEAWLEEQARISLQRLLPRVKRRYSRQAADKAAWRAFVQRLEANFGNLFQTLFHLYGQQYDFFYHLENIIGAAARMWLARPDDLKMLDAAREADPLWYQSQAALAGVCYVDLFAGDLNGLREKLDYFDELGLTVLHLMPVFQAPANESDGGYAVSSYRHVNPAIGSMDDLRGIAADLRARGISLMLDFVFNHTSDEHEWAQRALRGDPEYQNYYWMFPNRTVPDAYQAHLREIFPTERPSSFTYRDDIRRWVWTTFHSYQWDLNYANPEVFIRMAEEMLFLANAGVEILRLDAVAFIWKQMGTRCENLPEAHLLIRAFNALARIAAPALLFNSEAIVHPDEVAHYISPDECQLSYNPLLMALLWNSLATREVRLLRKALQERFAINPSCAWVNYVRCHDDIGWTFSDEDANALWINPHDHRRFLNDFYTGKFPGSFARGLHFQENPRTGDARIAGTCASLAGLEKAIYEETDVEIDLAVKRVVLLHSVILSAGGIPLIYLGDEIGMLNDYSYRNSPQFVRDSRWVHRPVFDWQVAAGRHCTDTPSGRIYSELARLSGIRRKTAAFAGGALESVDTGSDHVLGYVRTCLGNRVLVLANFTETEQPVSANHVRLYGLTYTFTDLVTGETIALHEDIRLHPYQFMWLADG